jgi:hypothetical protein
MGVSLNLITRLPDGRTQVSLRSDIERGVAVLFGVSSQGSEPLVHTCMARLLSGATSDAEGPAVGIFKQHLAYYRKVMSDFHVDPLQIWSRTGYAIPQAEQKTFENYIGEFAQHIVNFLTNYSSEYAAKSLVLQETFAALDTTDEASRIIPVAIGALRSEARFQLIYEHFAKTLDVPGDVCEFGCFRGFVSLKLAFVVKALGLHKNVYAFDTFRGFEIGDPAGGALGVGAFSDNHRAFHELSKWSKVLPLQPIKGDATKTWKVLSQPLSFVWFDLDMDILMAPVLDGIWPYLHRDTVIGIDDVGRPETPTVGPWVDKLIADRRLVELERYDDSFIRFLRPNKS